jgi:hypothetical protein
MPSAESIWQPQIFLRVVKSLATSAATVQIVTDQGDGYLKALGNPTGPHLLACEWVATQLARRLGLPTLDFTLMDVTTDDEIPFAEGGHALPGPAFITRAERNVSWGGSVEELRRVDNPQDIGRLVVFDTWTLNCDRYHPDQTRRKPHYDNVFLSEETQQGKFLLKAIDHTHCFTCGRDLSRQLANIDRVQDEQIYGLFPGFLPYLRHEDVRQAIQDLRTITQPEIAAIVGTIPTAWEVDQPSRDALVELISRRANFIAGRTESIIDSMQLTGEGS